jgi:DNA adenine methylase
VTHQVIDNVRLLMQRFAMTRPLVDEDLGYLSKSVMVVLSQAADATVNCLLVAPAGPLASPTVELDKLTVNPGVYHLTGSQDAVQEKFCLLRELGYVLVMYRYAAVKEWIESIDSIAVSDKPTADPYGLVELSRQLPRVHVYCELFGGSAPLLCCKEPSPVEVVNDRGSFVVDFMKLLRHIDGVNLLVLLSRIFPFSVQLEPNSLRRFVQTTPRQDLDVVRCFSWYRMIRESYRLACPDLHHEARKVAISDQRLLQGLQILDPYLPSLHGRLMRVQYENNQYHKILESFDSANTLFWVDVPLMAGQDDNTAEVVHTLQQLEHQRGHVAVYWRPSCSNLVLSRLIQEGLLSTWQQYQLPGAVVYTKAAS